MPNSDIRRVDVTEQFAGGGSSGSGSAANDPNTPAPEPQNFAQASNQEGQQGTTGEQPRNWLDDLRAIDSNLHGGAEYPNKPTSTIDQINAMSNFDKLDDTEKWLYKKLPGFSESGVGKALASFAETNAGKALAKLDILAEGLERTLGVAAQLRDANPYEEFKWKEAWEAGSMFWDTVRLPKMVTNENGTFHFEIDTDLPGTIALTEARKKLQDGAELPEVLDAYYKNLGALAIRSQLQDTFGHIVADPLNSVLGFIKPIERIQGMRHLALTGKVAPEIMQDMIDSAKLAGNLEEAAKIAQALEKAQESGKAITKLDKVAIFVTGGMPWAQDVTKMSKTKKFLTKLNPLALTPAARAEEVQDIIRSNIGAYLIVPNWNKDPTDIIESISKMAKGSIGDEWGHLAATLQGRTVQAAVSGAEGAVKTIGKEWTVFAKERNMMEGIGEFLGVNASDVWKMAHNDPAVLFKQIASKAAEPGAELILKELQKGTLTEQTLESLGKLSKEIPWTKEEFYLKTLAKIEDIAMQQSIIQFGVKQKGFLTKISDAIKAWETLPFIRANPGNAVRNMINNEVTLIGRGLPGVFDAKAIEKFWEGKWMPPQLKRAFSFGIEKGDIDLSMASNRLAQTLDGTNLGVVDKAKKFAQDIKLGAFDFAEYSSKAELAASVRASTGGWMEFHQKYWKADKGFTSITSHLPSDVIDELEKISPGMSRMLDDFAETAGGDPEKFAELMKIGTDQNVAAVYRKTTESLGYDIEDVLGAELSQRLRDGLPEAMKNGTQRQFVEGLKTQMEAHVDEMFSKHLEELPGIIAAQVQAGGAMQYHRIFGKAMDEFWSGNVEHAIRMSTVNEAIDVAKASGDFEAINSMWNKILGDGESHFGRLWKKFDAYQDGLAKGAKEAGIKYPGEVKASFKDMKKGWEDLFKTRNSEYKKFFDAKLKGKEYTKTLEDIQAQIDDLYASMTVKEDELFQRIDDVMADSMDDFSGSMWKNYRDEASQLRIKDRTYTQEFFKEVRDAPVDSRPDMYSKYWAERTQRLEEMKQLDRMGSSAIQGDPRATGVFARQAPTGSGDIYDIAHQYGIPSATDSGARNNKRILNTVNKYIDESLEPFTDVKAIPPELAREAFENRLAMKAEAAAKAAEQSFIPDADMIFKDMQPIETALSEMHYGRSYGAMEELIRNSEQGASKTAGVLEGIPEHLKPKIESWMRNVETESSAFRSAATGYASFRRDSALLNYSRRTNFDNWVGHLAPFAFWTTHSMAAWAVNSLDRPAMLTSYFRAKKFFETAGLPDQNLPSRLKGQIKVQLPFAPDWMGEQFMNPLRVALPFDSWQQPWEMAQQNKFTKEGKATKALEEMLKGNEITERDYKDAIANKSGFAWDKAMAMAEEGGDQYNAMDFVNMTMTPHAPLMWAYNIARGQKNEIGAFTPMSRSAKNFATMMGVDDWNNSGYNVEGKIRKWMGLPAYDKWDDYRTARMISNIAAEKQFDVKETEEAMMIASMVEAGQLTSKEAVEQNEIYALATKRANQEYAGGWAGTILGLLGMPVKSYPEGEKTQRMLAEKFSEAYAAKDAGDSTALAKFFDDYPEYESRMALFKSPQERLKNFAIDNIWNRWNELPKVNQDELKQQLGKNFEQNFMNKETRNYEAITPLQMQVWSKLMGATPVGTLSAETEAMIELGQMKLTDPETAWRVQTFYDMRSEVHPDWYEVQQGYYAQPEGAKREQYLMEHPELRGYWNDRSSWMEKNPDLVKYLTDNEKTLAKYANRKVNETVNVPSAEELKANFSQPTLELVNEWFAGSSLPEPVDEYLQEIADEYGLDKNTMLQILASP